jgi:hypothetical protein
MVVVTYIQKPEAFSHLCDIKIVFFKVFKKIIKKEKILLTIMHLIMLYSFKKFNNFR